MRTKLYVALVTVALTTCGCTKASNTAAPDSSNAESDHAHNESDATKAGISAPGATATVPTEESPNHTPTPETSIQPAESVRMIAWNVESGGNDPDVISNQLSEFQGCDVICLSEVNEPNFERYASALQDKYHECHGQTGRSDRLQIFVKRDRYDVLEQQELSQHREHVLNKGNHRSPLYVRIKDRTSGAEMLVMTNHLARGNAQFRQEQAVGLREWARDQNVPVIALGDFNMDYDYREMKGNAAFDEMLRDNVWSWVAPGEFIDTNWSDRDGDGNDNYPDSMLDLAFAAGAAKEWGIQCSVIVRPDDFPDDKTTSDHRPIELTFAR